MLTTSYPRDADDVAGTFVRDSVEALRAAGVEIVSYRLRASATSASPTATGSSTTCARAPWKAVALPLFLLAFARAARRAARSADLVHAHWLPSALPALATRKPFVLQLWGSDVALARRVRPLARWLVRRARLVVCASTALGADARALGARRALVIPTGVDPARNRGSARRAAARPVRGAPLRGEGRARARRGSRRPAARRRRRRPLRALFPHATGFVPPSELGAYYERAAVVVVPSRREGYGMVAREAMAYGRPVVATAVGGLVDVVEDGVTGVLVRPRDSAAMSREVRRLLDDAGLRARLGAAARDRAREQCSWERARPAALRCLAARSARRRGGGSRSVVADTSRGWRTLRARVRLRTRIAGRRDRAVRATLARRGRIRIRRGSSAT